MANIYVRPAKIEEWEPAMDLVWRTFLRFEADEYAQEGVDNFWEFIYDETLRRMFCLGQYKLFVALTENDTIVGVISIRDGNHISLLFVDEGYHRQGVGTALVKYVTGFLNREMGKCFVTVNASPYGVPFYKQVGFQPLGEEVTERGIIFTPMRLVIDGKES